MPSYDWVTSEMFDAELERQVSKVASAELLAIPGVYEVLSEHFNNDVLEALEEYLPFTVVDDHGVKAGERCPVLGRFATEQLAAQFIGTLPDHTSGRYGLDGPSI